MPLTPSCQHCGRALTDPQSMRDGFGPICRGNIGVQQNFIDVARRAVKAGYDDANLRVAVRCLDRREGVLLRYTNDEVVLPLHAAQITEIRQEIERKVKRLIRGGYLPPIEISHELADMQVSAKGGVAQTAHFIGC